MSTKQNPIKLDENFPIIQLVQNTNVDEPIPVHIIQDLSSHGLDMYSELDRAYAWLLMLGILPPTQNKWESVYAEHRKSYQDFKLLYNIQDWDKVVLPVIFTERDFHIQNAHTMLIIHQDLYRSASLLYFFPPQKIEGSEMQGQKDVLYDYSAHIRRLERILYIFAQLNPGLSYLQGYHALLLPFFYVLIKSKFFNKNSDDVEMLSFAYFQIILSNTNLSNLYTVQDNNIIYHTLEVFTSLQKKHMPKIYNIFTKLNIIPMYYCFPWFTTLFNGLYDLPLLLILWDSLFAHFNDFINFLFYIGLGQIKEIENDILAHPKEMNYILSKLQGIHNLDVKNVLKHANAFYNKDHH